MNSLTISGFTSKEEYSRVTRKTVIDEQTGEERNLVYVNTTIRHQRSKDQKPDQWQVTFSGSCAEAFLRDNMFGKLLNINGELVQEVRENQDGSKSYYTKIKGKSYNEINWQNKQNNTSNKTEAEETKESPKKAPVQANIKKGLEGVSKDELMALIASTLQATH